MGIESWRIVSRVSRKVKKFMARGAGGSPATQHKQNIFPPIKTIPSPISTLAQCVIFFH
jgi:hypothetical protein